MKKSRFFEQTDKIALFLLVTCLGFRDILPSIGKDVYALLMFVYLIPIILLIRDVVYKELGIKELSLALAIILFYISVVPVNENGLKFFLPLYLAGIAFRNTNFRYISKLFFIMQFIVLFVRILLVYQNVLHVDYWHTEKINSGVSYDLGYGNPNALGCNVFFICCYLFLFGNKLMSFLIILFITILTFYFTACRTSLYLSVLLMFACFIPFKWLRKLFVKDTVLYLILFTLFAPILFSSFLLVNYEEINLLLSGRLRYMSQFIELFNSPLLFFTGIPVDLGDLEFAVDNSIAYMLLCGGVLFIAIFIMRFIYIIKNKDHILMNVLIVLALIILSGLTESVMSRFGFAGASFFWILLFNRSYILKKS